MSDYAILSQFKIFGRCFQATLLLLCCIGDNQTYVFDPATFCDPSMTENKTVLKEVLLFKLFFLIDSTEHLVLLAF
jgi:hypothetical protein